LSVEFLFDTSAWTRSKGDSLTDSRADEIADDYESGRLAVCLPFLLEVGVSARSSRDHAELLNELMTLPFVRIDEQAERRALKAQAELVRVGHHRKVPPVDLLIAALADRHGLGVLHYDKDFDFIVEKTDLDFHSEWLMPRGSLN
jgi:predicted nucleic acid-binding protein